MSGPKRNPDRLNTIGVVVVGICGAVLVYVSIVALQAFYMNDTSEVQTMADYGGQDTAHQSLRATQVNTIEDCGPNGKPEASKQQTYRIPIKYAIKLVADGAKVDPSNLIPTQGHSDKPTILPIFGRPKVAPKAADKPADPVTPPGTNAPLTPTGGTGAGGGPATGQGPTQSGGPGSTGGVQTPAAGSASPGGNPPTPAPKLNAPDPKAGTAPPMTGATPKAPAPKAGSGSAAPKK